MSASSCVTLVRGYAQSVFRTWENEEDGHDLLTALVPFGGPSLRIKQEEADHRLVRQFLANEIDLKVGPEWILFYQRALKRAIWLASMEFRRLPRGAVLPFEGSFMRWNHISLYMMRLAEVANPHEAGFFLLHQPMNPTKVHGMIAQAALAPMGLGANEDVFNGYTKILARETYPLPDATRAKKVFLRNPE